MISIQNYVGVHVSSPDWTPERQANALKFLPTVNAFIARAIASGIGFQINPTTNTQIAGITFGGFRPQNCTQGSPHSSHKEGLGIDIYDPDEDIDNYITDQILEEQGLYREHPSKTKSWCHLTTRAPSSGVRTFYP